MMPPLVRTAGRRLRHYVMPLVGFWDVIARLDRLHTRFNALEATQAAQLAAQAAQLAAQRPLVATLVQAEIDRLDGYLVHHVATLRNQLAALQAELPVRLAATQADLQARLADLQAQHDAQARPPEPARPHLGHHERAHPVHGVGTLVLAGEFDLLVPAQELGLLAYLMRHGTGSIEPGVRAVLRDRLRPGDAAVDGGANIGLHTLTMAAAVGPAGSLVCFEPVPHLADALTWTVRLNGFAAQARVERSALSDRPGSATLHVTPHSPSSSLFALPDSLAARDVVVPTVTLDDSFAPGSRVDVIKLDIEGAEPFAWRGMQRVRADNPRLDIVLEWSASHFARAGEQPAAFFRAIRAEGFAVAVIEDAPDAGRLRRLDDPEAAAGLEAANLLLTKRGGIADAA